jgi:hypothetical protein
MLVRKTISNLLLFLEELFEEMEVQNTILLLFKSYASYLTKRIFTK